MKRFLLFLLSIIAGAQASAQTISPEPKIDPHDIRLYQATVRTMHGESINGIFYAITDSTLVLFANNQPTIKQFRAGQLPDLYTLEMDNVKRISIRRKSHFLRQTAIGVGLGAAFLGLGTLLINSKDGIGPVSFGFFINYLVAPAMVVGGMGQGFIPRHIERIRGNADLFKNAHHYLAQYTIVNQ